jgi:predicted metalloprotease with PDZ domain
MKQAFRTLILILLTLGSVWGRSDETEFSDRYSLTFDSTDTHSIHVKARLYLEDSLLYMSPYGPMPERWPQYIKNLMVRSADGKPVHVCKMQEGTWILDGSGAGMEVELTYDLVLEHEQIEWPGGIDGVAYRRDWGIMVTGRSLFVMNGKRKKDILVRVGTPASWNVSTSWRPDNRSKKAYRAGTLVDLQESFLVAGTHKEMNIHRDGFTLKFVLGGEKVERETSRYVKVATEVLDYYIGLMGGIPKPGPGRVLKESLVIISQSEAVDGEVIGNHLSMFMNPEGTPMDQMMGWFMFAHEFYHLWNGKTLRFADTTTDWFKEGISNYYTIKALYQTGFIDEEIVGAMLNNLFYQRYLQDPGYSTLPPSRAASGFDKDNHWGLVYGGGLFAGIAMDMEIRRGTGNSASLDDLMRGFYQEYGGKGKQIRQADILARANEIGKADFTRFMDVHIQGPEPISLSPYLEYAGVSVDTSGGQLKLTHVSEKSDMEAALWEGFLGGN